MRHLILPVLTGSLLLAAVACSDDDSGNNNTNNTGGSNTGGGNTGGGNTGGGNTGGGNTGGGNTGGGNTGGSPGAGTFIDATTAGLTVGTGAYDYVDTGGSTVKLTNPEPGKLCGAGTAAQVVNMMYSEIWGGGIAVQLADPGSFDASAYDGISFTITGLPSAIRVGVTIAADTNNAFFTSDVIEGANSLLWADLAQGEWAMPPATFDAATLKDIQFQVPASDMAAIPFDFCVTDVAFIGGMGGQGGAGN